MLPLSSNASAASSSASSDATSSCSASCFFGGVDRTGCIDGSPFAGGPGACGSAALATILTMCYSPNRGAERNDRHKFRLALSPNDQLRTAKLRKQQLLAYFARVSHHFNDVKKCTYGHQALGT